MWRQAQAFERVALAKLGRIYPRRLNEKSLYIAVEAFVFVLAERTGLEPATPGVTGRYSNQLNYRSFSKVLTHSAKFFYRR